MLANKLVKTPVNLDIKELTLLTEEEAMTLLTKEQRQLCEEGVWAWWLRSPAPDNPSYVCVVGRDDGELYVEDVDCIAAVIPALKISNMKSLGLKTGERIQVAGETWGVISDDIAWCERSIGISYFRTEKWLPDMSDYVPDANKYEKSDVKKRLDKWALLNMSRPNKTAQTYKLSPELVDFDIKEITLLSEKEAKSMLNKHSELVRRNFSWWLRTTGNCPDEAFFVHEETVYRNAWINQSLEVRPALRISNLKSLNISEGDKVEVGGETWTVISDDLALCDRSVGRTHFRSNIRVSTAMLYEKSDVKKWINSWALEKGVVTQENIEQFYMR